MRLETSAGSANSCSRPSVLKVAVVAAAAELLRLACESADGLTPLNGNDEETLTAGGAPGRGQAPASCPCRCVDRWPWRWRSRRQCLVLLRRPARETSKSDENAFDNTENREQAHVGLLLLACRHRPLQGVVLDTNHF